jgi:hypothetical protein
VRELWEELETSYQGLEIDNDHWNVHWAERR